MLETVTSEIGTIIREHQMWAGPIVGLIVFGESLAFVGLLVPATALMLLTGGLVATGTLDAWTVLAWAIGGAIVGDAVSYFLGRWVGPGISRRWPLNRHRPSVAKARLFFRKYGLASIFFGRFLGPIRSTVPLVAGTLMMNHRKFQIANVASALIWVPVMLAPGYLAAKGLEAANIHSSAGVTIGVIVASVVGTVLGAYAIRAIGRHRPERRARPSASAS